MQRSTGVLLCTGVVLCSTGYYFGGVVLLVVVSLCWLLFCFCVFAIVVFWWYGDVFVVAWWCFRGGVYVFCGGGAVFLCWCGFVCVVV